MQNEGADDRSGRTRPAGWRMGVDIGGTHDRVAVDLERFLARLPKSG